MPFSKKTPTARGRRSVVSSAAVPMAYSIEERFKPSYRTVIEAGTEQLAPVAISTTDSSNTVVAVYELNPMSFASSRLRDLASLYQNFKFTSISFVYEPMVPTITAGSLYFGYCVDIDDPISIGDSFLTGLSRLDHSRTAVFAPTRFTLGQKDFQKFVQWYWTYPKDDSSRVSSQGKFFIGYSGPVGTAITLGNLQMDWEISLQRPSGPVAGVTSTAEPLRAHITAGINATPDYLKLFDLVKNSAISGLTGRAGGLEPFKIDGVIQGLISGLKANSTTMFVPGLKMVSQLINIPTLSQVTAKSSRVAAPIDYSFEVIVLLSNVGFVGPESSSVGTTYLAWPTGHNVTAGTSIVNGYPRVALSYLNQIGITLDTMYGNLTAQFSMWGNTKVHTAYFVKKVGSDSTFYAQLWGSLTISNWEETLDLISLFSQPTTTTEILCGATCSSPTCILPGSETSPLSCSGTLRH